MLAKLRYLLIILVLGLYTSSCKADYRVTKAIKPRKHLFAYNPKWHKKAGRTRTVTLKH
jgi:hypothetical protein